MFDTQSGKAAISMVSAWASANRLVLGQRKVDEKSNEITAVPELLESLMLKGCIVTLDALNCQTRTAETIVARGADYLLVLKANHPLLHEDVKLLFDTLAEDLAKQASYTYAHDYAKTVDKDHGRIEVRHAWTIQDADLLSRLRTASEWPHLTTLVKMQAERYVSDKHAVQTRYYISSADASADKFLGWIRTHWSIENSLHWVLDISFREMRVACAKTSGPSTSPPCVILRSTASDKIIRLRSASRTSTCVPAGTTIICSPCFSPFLTPLKFAIALATSSY